MISIKWIDIQETDCSTDIYTFHFAKKIELYILRLSSFRVTPSILKSSYTLERKFVSAFIFKRLTTKARIKTNYLLFGEQLLFI